jgi:hypothetical protein
MANAPIKASVMMFGVADVCPSCGAVLTGRTLGRSMPRDRAGGLAGVELRRCGSCRRLAQRAKGGSNEWVDAGLDASIDYLFDWRPEPLPSPWELVPAEQREALEAELTAEVAEGHPLFGAEVTAIARCGGCDEVVFSVDVEPVRFVSVHLTWRGGSEQPPWPWTEDVRLPLSRSLTRHGH